MKMHRVVWRLLALTLIAMGPVGAAWAQVKVTSADPASAVQGTASLDVTIGGSGFDNGSQVRFLVTGTELGGGIEVTKVVYVGPKKLIATINVTNMAVVSQFDIEVRTSTDRKGKGTTLFAVKSAPTDPCIGAGSRAFPSFAFTRQATINGVVTWKTILADATGQCERVVTTYSYNSFNSDLSFHYNDSERTGVIVRGGPGGHSAARVSVTFDLNDVPSVHASPYVPVLASSDLPVPPDLSMAGWVASRAGDPFISPDGSTILLAGMLANATGQQMQVFWTCPFDSSSLNVDEGDCRIVYQSSYDGSVSDYVTARWGARSDAILLVQAANSGMGLYRLTLADGQLEQLWSRGTLWTFAKATLNASQGERVAVYEPDPVSLCSRVLVVDTETCSGNDCLILNGAGHPARNFGWLPDGRIAGEGQTAPSRKGKCSTTGSITAFDPTDTTGSTATIVTDGYAPQGTGGD